MSFTENFKKVIRECNYSNTYKMAWAKALVESSSIVEKKKDKLINIDLESLAQKMFRYYWDQTIFFNLFQSAPNQPPIILSKVKKLIDLYQKQTADYKPIIFDKVAWYISVNLEKEYKRAIKTCIANIKTYVIDCFLNLERATFTFYKIDKSHNLIIFKRDDLQALYANQDDLFDLINYRWSLMLENYNSCPRIAKKVRIMDERGVARSTLKSFDKYLDLENHEHICFICGKKIDDKDLSRDHVIPWSYVYSDDLWNIVYVHKSCNSSKSNITPSKVSIVKLKERNDVLLKKLESYFGTKHPKILQEFDYAIKHEYVDKFFLGCKGC